MSRHARSVSTKPGGCQIPDRAIVRRAVGKLRPVKLNKSFRFGPSQLACTLSASCNVWWIIDVSVAVQKTRFSGNPFGSIIHQGKSVKPCDLAIVTGSP